MTRQQKIEDAWEKWSSGKSKLDWFTDEEKHAEVMLAEGFRNAITELLNYDEGEIEYEFEVWVNDDCLASGISGTLNEAIAEGNHYSMMYSEEGKVTVQYYERRKIEAPLPTAPKGEVK